jgi:transposase InsO family protein
MDNFNNGNGNDNNKGKFFIDDRSTAYEIASDRLNLILPLCDHKLHRAEIRALTREIAKEAGLSVKTIQRYFKRFCENKFDGLLPISNGRPGTRSIPLSILEEAAKLRQEVPGRTVLDIIKTLELEELVPVGSIKRSTLQEQLSKIGCGSSQLKIAAQSKVPGGQRFQRKERNSLWQSDSKHGPYIDGRKTYLISFIDDYSRLVLNSKFYFSESTESICDCFREAITKYGTPRDVYFDNGKPYKSNVVKRACEQLEIKKMHHKAYTAKSKGKIEKFHQFVDKFIEELKLDKTNSIITLNSTWNAFLTVFYHHKIHAGLKNEMTPEEAFNKDSAPYRLVSQEKLYEAFLHAVYGRRVDRSGCVNFQGKKYTANDLNYLIGKKVDIFWDPTNLSKLWIQFEKMPLMEGAELKIREWVPKSPNPNPRPIKPIARKSRFLEAATKESLRLDSIALKRLNGCVKIEDSVNLEQLFVDDASGHQEISESLALKNQEEIIKDPKNLERLSVDDDSNEGAVNPNMVVKRPLIKFKDMISERKQNRPPLDRVNSTPSQGISFNSINKIMKDNDDQE